MPSGQRVRTRLAAPWMLVFTKCAATTAVPGFTSSSPTRLARPTPESETIQLEHTFKVTHKPRRFAAKPDPLLASASTLWAERVNPTALNGLG
jgi:hypothetical protein